MGALRSLFPHAAGVYGGRGPRSQGSVPSPAVPPRRVLPAARGRCSRGRAAPAAFRLSRLQPRFRPPEDGGTRGAVRGEAGAAGAGPGRAGRGGTVGYGTAWTGTAPSRTALGSAGRRWRANLRSAPPVPKSAQCLEPRAGRWAPRERKICLGREGGQRAGLKPFLGCCRFSRDRGQGCSAASPHTLGVRPRSWERSEKASSSGQREPAPHGLVSPPRSRCCGPAGIPRGAGSGGSAGSRRPGSPGQPGRDAVAPWPPRTALLQL